MRKDMWHNTHSNYDDNALFEDVRYFNNSKIEGLKDKRGKNMNINKIMDKFKIEKNEDIKLTFKGTMAVETENGYISFENGQLINNQDMIIDMDGIFYNIPHDKSTLKKGDLVLLNDKYFFFIEKNEYIGLDGTIKKIENINDAFFGSLNLSNMVIKVVSMFNNNGTNSNFNNIQNMLLVQKIFSNSSKDKDDKEDIFNTILKMQMITSMFGQNNNQNLGQNMFGNIFGIFNQQPLQDKE